MAIFRKVHTSFWEDTKICDDMTPEDRYFMLYILTNPHSNQVGCYEISTRQIAYETGYNQETIIKLLDRFENILKVIKYDNKTKEIFIKNWERYNWSKSPKVVACILKEAKTIKSIAFKDTINSVLIEYGYSIDTQTQEEQEQEQEQEQEKKEEIRTRITPGHKETDDIIKTYSKYFNKSYRLSFKEKSEICNITNQEQYTLDDWELIFKNASKGWMIKNENVKPSLTNILENYSKFLNDDYNLYLNEELKFELETETKEEKDKKKYEEVSASINSKKEAIDYILKIYEKDIGTVRESYMSNCYWYKELCKKYNIDYLELMKIWREM